LLRYQSLATMTGRGHARGTPHQESSSMSDVKKDHSIGEGTGAVAGTVTGAAVGSVAGPVGTVVGAVVGGVVGAKAGDSIAEAIDPTDYKGYVEANYKIAPDYSSGRDWGDDRPAYQYSYDAYGRYGGQRFEDVEPHLERDWETSRARSRLAWPEAR